MIVLPVKSGNGEDLDGGVNVEDVLAVAVLGEHLFLKSTSSTEAEAEAEAEVAGPGPGPGPSSRGEAKRLGDSVGATTAMERV